MRFTMQITTVKLMRLPVHRRTGANALKHIKTRPGTRDFTFGRLN